MMSLALRDSHECAACVLQDLLVQLFGMLIVNKLLQLQTSCSAHPNPWQGTQPIASVGQDPDLASSKFNDDSRHIAHT